MSSNKKFLTAFFILSVPFLFAGHAGADTKNEKEITFQNKDLLALWRRPSNGAVIQGYKCEKGYGLRIVKSPKTEYVGKSLGCAVETAQGNKLHGDLINPYDGKTYSGYVKLIDHNTLRMEGCILFGMICRGEDWKRIEKIEE